MKLIVGSTALKMYGYNSREPQDLDIFTDNPSELPDTETKLDNHILPKELLELFPQGYGYATPDAIYTLKCSHAAWDIHWSKTMSDIMYLKDKGCRLLPNLYWKLYYYWQTVHGDKSFLSLNKTKSQFFTDYVPYRYDHDYLHSVVAHPHKPLYNKVLKDNQEVLIDRGKFLRLSREEQIKLFKEEICVIALERWLIPTDFKMARQKAYRLALKKTITNLTKNWATLFIVDNYLDFHIMHSTVWYSNFIKLTGREIKMHPIIKKVQDKALELELDDAVAFNNLGIAYGDGPEEDTEFGQFLLDMGWKLIEHEGGEGQGDDAHDVIELEGELFRIDYSYASFDGYYVDEEFDNLHHVKAVKKEIISYE